MSYVEQASGVHSSEHYRVIHHKNYGEVATVVGAVEVLSSKGYRGPPQSKPLGNVIAPTAWLILIALIFLCY